MCWELDRAVKPNNVLTYTWCGAGCCTNTGPSQLGDLLNHLPEMDLDLGAVLGLSIATTPLPRSPARSRRSPPRSERSTPQAHHARLGRWAHYG